MQENENLIIDAVITWVDGNDPLHKTKMANYIEVKSSLNSKSVRMRYDQVNEIEYAVKSILKYAKFVRNIFIVTDNQIPDFLKDKENAKENFSNVFIIDHKTIFKANEDYLPTFNSLSIETLLFKIPDLAEHFLYFNDDFFLANPTTTKDFFINRKPVIRGHWSAFYEDIWHKKLKRIFFNIINKKQNITYKHRKGLQKPAAILGFKRYFFTEHTPSAIRKSTLENFFSENIDLLSANIQHRFRESNQFVMHSLANHLEIKAKTCVLKNDFQLIYFQNYKKPIWWIKNKLRKTKTNNKKLFLCMQSLGQCPDGKLAYIKKWLSDKYD
ncbi:stealth family protein [Polaribacter atrinae]|uniref:stealth family protein n=1 Tax=Polaribacter atrinae TaxID=1333662 RepID=UPI002493B9C7|nr:stealth family protein [Polaribacter atrinae]